MIKYLTALAIALAGLPAFAGNTMEDHRRLMATTQRYVTVYINPTACHQNKAHGWYVRSLRELVICQDNMVKAGVMVGWTNNDLDTLRHEVHHIIQDCSAGVIGDGYASVFINDELQYRRFIDQLLSPQAQRVVRDMYPNIGEQRLRMELEAFAVAANIPASDITRALVKTCK